MVQDLFFIVNEKEKEREKAACPEKGKREKTAPD
jgi:hypothetical protein